MTTKDMTSGAIIRYSYLWYREDQRGDVSGRKDRPVCVHLVLAQGGREIAVLFPITSRPPSGQTRALAVPLIEAKRVGLSVPAWIVINEDNEDHLPTSPYVADTEPLGHFSKAFLLTILKAVREIVKEGKYKRVDRRYKCAIA